MHHRHARGGFIQRVNHGGGDDGELFFQHFAHFAGGEDFREAHRHGAGLGEGIFKRHCAGIVAAEEAALRSDVVAGEGGDGHGALRCGVWRNDIRFCLASGCVLTRWDGLMHNI